MKEFCDLFIKPALVGLLTALVLIGGCDFYRKVIAAEAAQQAPAERPPTVEELLVAKGRTEAQKEMLVNQAQGQIDQLDARLRAIDAEIQKLKGGAPPTKGAKQ